VLFANVHRHKHRRWQVGRQLRDDCAQSGEATV
jgi:hypothetical protein